jgi:formylmethanofuran dehydrogenase subunit A
MSEYVIKNGHVFDPVQGIKGDKAEVAIKDGKIVEKAGSGAKVIDAKGMTVMAGAVEIHAHIAGPKVNLGRIYRPEDKLFTCTPTKGMERMGSGNSIPSTFKTGYEYAKMGYTTCMEAAMPPMFSRHVHEEIRDTPIIDEGAFPVFGNNWFVMEYLKNHEVENTAAYIAWMLRATKGYAVKVVNPGGTEAWAWGLNCLTVNDPVPYFDITPAEIVKGLIESNEYLGLPHSMHIHPNNLGNPGCYETTLDTLKLAEGMKANNKFGRESVMHLTHTQFHSYGGTNWGDFESKAKEVTDYVNKNRNITIDTGNVTLDETTTMTADGPFEHHLTVPYIYSPNISVCAIQWAIGLEIPLMMKDPMRCYITTDHPNAGPFTRYPRVFKWLMSTKAREEQINAFKHKDKVLAQTSIGSLDREISLYELAQMTRAGPAKSLGLGNMCGGLKPGMDADVAIYNFNPEKPVANPDDIEKAFTRCAFTFKSGVEVVRNGEIVSTGHKRTLWVNAKVKDNPQVVRDINEKFLKYYSMTQANYESLGHHFVPNPFAIEVDAT